MRGIALWKHPSPLLPYTHVLPPAREKVLLTNTLKYPPPSRGSAVQLAAPLDSSLVSSLYLTGIRQ